MDFRDYYATLGVPKTATEKEIKQAYRRLARKHHPDVNPGDRSAETRFKELNEAYEVLGTPETRKKYDELGANWRQYEQAGGPGGGPWAPQGGQAGPDGFRTMTPEEMESMFGAGGSPFSDFFNTFFGGGGQAPSGGRGRRPSAGARQRRAPEVEYEIPLDLASTLGGHVERVQVQPQDGPPRTLEVRIPAGWDEYIERVVQAVPGDRAPIERCLTTLRDVAREARNRYLPGAETPTFDALAATGVIFRQFYIGGNESQASHSSLWTSLYPARHGVRTAGDHRDPRGRAQGPRHHRPQERA